MKEIAKVIYIVFDAGILNWMRKIDKLPSNKYLKLNIHRQARKPSHLQFSPQDFGRNKTCIPYGKLPQPDPQAAGRNPYRSQS